MALREEGQHVSNKKIPGSPRRWAACLGIINCPLQLNETVPCGVQDIARTSERPCRGSWGQEPAIRRVKTLLIKKQQPQKF
jgi:hypothetical protein